MSLRVHTYNNSHYLFDGPHTHTGPLLKQSGVYVITTLVNGIHKVLDVGESHNVQHRIENHDRMGEWQRHIVDTLYVSVLYCNETGRMAVESAIRQFHNPQCGVR